MVTEMNAVRVRETPFNYAELGPESRIVVRQKTTEIRDRVRRALEDVVAIGERLLIVKGHLEHGQFGAWLTAEFAWSEATAVRMMKVAARLKNVNLTNLNIGPSVAYLLAPDSVPAEVVAEVLESAKGPEPVTVAAVKEKIEAARPDNPPPQLPDQPSAAKAQTDSERESPSVESKTAASSSGGKAGPAATPNAPKKTAAAKGNPPAGRSTSKPTASSTVEDAAARPPRPSPERVKDLLVAKRTAVDVDHFGKRLPDDGGVRGAFEVGGDVDHAVSLIGLAVKHVQTLPLLGITDENASQIDSASKTLKNALKAFKAYAVCPGCKGGGKDKAGVRCGYCKGRRWLAAWQYLQLPKELQEAAK